MSSPSLRGKAISALFIYDDTAELRSPKYRNILAISFKRTALSNTVTENDKRKREIMILSH